MSRARRGRDGARREIGRAARHRRAVRRAFAGLLTIASAAWPLSAAATDTRLALAQHGGGELVLAAPATRLITLGPHLAELVFLAGAGDLLLATTEYSDFPPAAADLPRIGDAFRFDLERLIDLDPDLVIAWSSGNPGAALTAMDALGLPVWRTEVRTVGDMARLLLDLGRATGRDASAPAIDLRQRWAGLERRYADRPEARYFYQVAERPLYTVNGEHLISQGLAACGARNVFHDLPGLAPQVGIEAVLEADPDLLVTGRLAPEDDPLAHWRDWPRLAAVRDEGFVYLPADLINRATPRMLDAVESACAAIEAWRTARTGTGASP